MTFLSTIPLLYGSALVEFEAVFGKINEFLWNVLLGHPQGLTCHISFYGHLISWLDSKKIIESHKLKR